MARPEKIAVVESFEKLFKDSNAYFVTDFQGLSVSDMTVLRKNLRENKVSYLVAKNTLMDIAARNTEQPDLKEYFKGCTAIAFASDDPAVAAKILYDSYKEKELPRVKAFVVDSALYMADDIKRLAELPPREVLLSQLVAAVESPLTSLVGALDAVFRDLVGSIDALAEKRKAE
jgi:large subunit ribosomal protein L10